MIGWVYKGRPATCSYRLIGLLKLHRQAHEMQVPYDWLVAFTARFDSRDAKANAQPGSREMKTKLVSPRPAEDRASLV